MNLVISVIVALAILGIILFIISQIKPPGNDAKSIINKELTLQYSKGFGTSAPSKVSFEPGTSMYRKEALGELPVQEDEFTFVCKDSGICNGEPFSIENNVFKAKSKYEVYMGACVNKDREIMPKYCVSFSRTPSDATKDCVDACGIS